MPLSARPYNSDAYSSSHLVPRTPRSTRTTFAQQRQDLDADDQDEVDMLQTSPFLRSATSPSFPSNSQSSPRTNGYMQVGGDPSSKSRRGSTWQKQGFRGILKKVADVSLAAFEKAPLLLGTLFAFLLFGLWVLSIKRPDVLQKYIGSDNSTTSSAPSMGSMSSMDMPKFIDYSNYTQFPLTSMDYEHECWLLHQKPMAHAGYWTPTKDMDLDVPRTKQQEQDAKDRGVCSSTITYALDGSVGLGWHLALIAQLAGLARERNRTFFIDDTNWNRGQWTDHFEDVRKTQPGPEPGCRSPPPEELVACPRTAKHWIMTPRTAQFHFAHEFEEAFEDPYKHDRLRQKPIYDRALESLSKTIVPNDTTRQHLAYVRSLWGNQPYVGVHVRHGDRFPVNTKWKGDHLPISEFTKAVNDVWEKLKNTSPAQAPATGPINVYLATDSFAAFQDYKSLSASPDGVVGLHEAARAQIRYMAHPHGYIQRIWDQKSRPEERKRWTTGMIIDLAMMSGLWLQQGDRPPLATVCTVSSTICKLAAVGLGWERAFDEGYWIDLDWRGAVYPEWQAFDL